MSKAVKTHPLNIQGRFYVDYEICLDSEYCIGEAPNNFKMNKKFGEHIFLNNPKRQKKKLNADRRWNVVRSKLFIMTEMNKSR